MYYKMEAINIYISAETRMYKHYILLTFHFSYLQQFSVFSIIVEFFKMIFQWVALSDVLGR